MKRVRGDIQKEDAVILRNVAVWLTESRDVHSNLQSWCGSFSLRSGEHLEIGESYLLLLEDGCSGEFIVTSINTGTGRVGFVIFQGSGDLS